MKKKRVESELPIAKHTNNMPFKKPLKILPEDMWFYILSFLNTSDLVAVKQVSRFFHMLVLQNPFAQMLEEFYLGVTLLKHANTPFYARAYSTNPDIQKQLKRAQSEQNEFKFTITPQ